MLYYLQNFSEEISLLEIFRYPEFRAVMAAITSFVVAILFGRWFIEFQRRRSVVENIDKGDSARLIGLHKHKGGTPTMGGVILIVAVISGTLPWAHPENRIPYLLLFITVSFGAIGFADDWIKLRSPKKKGLNARTKMLLQMLLSGLVGLYLYYQPIVVIYPHAGISENLASTIFFPFFKSWYLPLGAGYILLVMLVTTATSNAVNLTDGLDGLAIGCSILVGVTLVTLAFLAGYESTSSLLQIPHVTEGLETAIFASAFVGSGLGFLWFNCHPAQIFMGDTGSLAVGAALGMIAVICKQEILLVLVGAVLVVEVLSVILQVASFKLRGKRIFLIAPLHHHFQFLGWKESTVTVRFWIVSAFCALGSLMTLKFR